MEKIRYTVITKDGKTKSYIDKSFCYCSAYTEPHKHPKKEVKS